MGTVEWGDIPTWLTGLGSVGALVFATVAVLYASRTYRFEKKREQVRLDEKRDQDVFVRRAQAALVSTWWGQDHPTSTESAWGISLRNASETPIYNAHITIQHTGLGRKSLELQFAVIPPNPTPDFHAVQPPGRHFPSSRHNQDSDHRVSLRFTDAAGLRWMRDEYGTLRQLEPNITIWASPETENVLEAFQAEFSATFGVTATFESRFIDSELERHFLEADEGPDILVGAHDWVGNLVANDAVEPINLTDTCRREFDGVEWALDALSCEGLTYARPSSLDTMALLRNLDLAPEAPRTFEELLAFGDALVAEHRAEQPLAIQVGRGGDPFQIWPLIASAGGWLFRRDANGLWNTRDIGIDSPESIVALEKIRELGARGVLRTETTSDIAVQAFARGETPFLFAMSEAVTRAREAGVNIEVTQIPGFADGGPAVPFVAVYGFFVGRRGRNKVIAADLAHDYLSRQDVVEYFGHSGYVVPREDSGDVDPNIAVFHRLCREGDLMPSFPQMRGVWGALGAAEVALIEGGETNSIAHSLATQISELF